MLYLARLGALQLFTVACNGPSFILDKDLGSLKNTSARPQQIYQSCNSKKEICLDINAIENKNLKIYKNSSNTHLSIEGQVEIKKNNQVYLTETISLTGEIHADGKIDLYPNEKNHSKLEVRGSAYCRDKKEDDSFDCNDLFVDIIIKDNTQFFTTQFETILKNNSANTKKLDFTESNFPDDKKNTHPQNEMGSGNTSPLSDSSTDKHSSSQNNSSAQKDSSPQEDSTPQNGSSPQKDSTPQSANNKANPTETSPSQKNSKTPIVATTQPQGKKITSPSQNTSTDEEDPSKKLPPQETNNQILINDAEEEETPDRYIGTSFEDIKRLFKPTPSAPEVPEDKNIKDSKAEPINKSSTKPAEKPKSEKDTQVGKANTGNDKNQTSSPKGADTNSPESQKSQGGESKLPVSAPASKLPTPENTRYNRANGCGIRFLCDMADTPIRPIDQAYGSPEKSNGRLTNPSNLFDYSKLDYIDAKYEIRQPTAQRHYGTYELMMIINDISRFTQKIKPDYILGIGDTSARFGGRLSPHASHRNGLEADIPYLIKNSLKSEVPMKNIVTKNSTSDAFDLENQWKLLTYLVATGKVDRIFVHRSVKNSFCKNPLVMSELNNSETAGLAAETLRVLRPRSADHGEHWHLRLKCSNYDKRCQQALPPPAGTGC